MPRTKLNEIILPTDRWTARVISPVDIHAEIDTDRYGEVVIVHPGWGKDPERHTDLLVDLANEGFLPLGVDTRYAYSDRQQPSESVLTQARTVGITNPYFLGDKAANRWALRRPTALLDVCSRLGVEERSYIGHSEGGRITTLAAEANPEQTKRLIVVNGAGTGDSSRGTTRLMRSNAHSIREFVSGEKDILSASRSALGSIAYTLSHPRRTLAEKRVIQSTNVWNSLGWLASSGVDVTVLHARDDELIQFEDSQAASRAFFNVNFIATPGNHSNVYEESIRKIIIQTLKAE